MVSPSADSGQMVASSSQQINGIGADDAVKDSEFWYEDGNVILVAHHVQFRIYQGILAEISPVLKEMFSLSNPAGSPTECLVVPLSDNPESVRRILRIIMPKGGRR